MLRVITSDFLHDDGCAMVKGRNFTDADRVDAPRVMIVSARLAAVAFPARIDRQSGSAAANLAGMASRR